METAAMDTASARRSLLSPTGWVVFLAVGFLLIVLVPVLNQVVTTGSAAHIPDYMIPLLGKYLCYALLAVSMDLIWGYAGILSLGHGAFFALGGYAMGCLLYTSPSPRDGLLSRMPSSA